MKPFNKENYTWKKQTNKNLDHVWKFEMIFSI